MVYGLLLVGVFLLAWSNGANDNFKGVATLYGSGATEFRPALIWATGATLLGSLVSVLIAHSLAISFSGKELIPDQVLVTAALVLGASRLGLPVSTTHVSCGSIFGIGMANRRGHRRTIARILTTWVTTLPLAFLLGLFFSWLLGAGS